MHMKLCIRIAYKRGIYRYELARGREKKSILLRKIRCINSEDNRVLVGEYEIKEMWKCNFQKLYNENPVRGIGVDDTYPSTNILY